MDNAIDKYKPQVSLSQVFSVDEDLPDNELTFVLFEKLKLARHVQDAVFIVMGKFLKLIRERSLYKYLDFDTFERFLASEELSFSREKAYLYIRIYELYIERLQLKEELIQELGVARLMLMNPIVKNIEDDDEAREKIEEFKSLRYGDFIRIIKQEKNLKGKPEVYWSEEAQKWIVNYFDDITHLISLGKHEEREKD